MCKIIEDMRMEEREEGRAEGRIEGRAEGREEGIKLTIARMLQAGKLALDEAAAISGLPLDEVKKLQTEQNA